MKCKHLIFFYFKLFTSAGTWAFKLDKKKQKKSCFNIFESYLFNRFQCTVVERVKSDFKEIKARVSQGSKWGFIYVFLYGSDIINGIESEI